MTLYPCTKNPPCPNNRRHHTPVCPEIIAGKTKHISAKQLKINALRREEFVQPDLQTCYSFSGSIKSQYWNAGNGPDGLSYREFYEGGKVKELRWGRDKRGPNGLSSIEYFENGDIHEEYWKGGKGPDGLSNRRFYENGQIGYEEWEENKGPKGAWLREYHENGIVSGEIFNRGFKGGPHGVSSYSRYENGQIESEEWLNGVSGPGGMYHREFYENGVLKQEEWGVDTKIGLVSRHYYENGKLEAEYFDPGKGPNGIQYRAYDEDGNITAEEE